MATSAQQKTHPMQNATLRNLDETDVGKMQR